VYIYYNINAHIDTINWPQAIFLWLVFWVG
jgi:hypothetical protein